VATLVTEYGGRLAVARDQTWFLMDALNAPKTVDELVKGGDRTRALAEADKGRPFDAGPFQLGLCVPWPGKIICVGLNYRQHSVEAKMKLTATPTLFSKFNNALVPSGQLVALPSIAEQYDYEAELAAVIGRRAFRVAESEALNYVWGYCNSNDLSARDLQTRTTQLLLGKTLDGFLPVGPELVSADEVGDPQKLTIRTWLNGEQRQNSSTSDMIFSVAELVSYISQYIPLEPGDLVTTGTPGGVIFGREDKTWMRPGDTVEIEIQHLGRLVTPLIAGP
jgi:2-keto-4-pentenoate hydratase/2-oxohepta-3-ene-1,7-dioic acid hydratase in catechol pathway